MSHPVSGRVGLLQQVIARATAASTIGEVARIMIHEGVEALGAWMGGVWLLDEPNAMLELLDWVGVDPGRRFRRVPLFGESPLALAVRTNKPVWIGNRADYVAAFPQSDTHVGPVVPDGDIATACVAIGTDHKPMGGIAFGFRTTHTFAPEERSYVQAIAEQCAHAMEKIRLVETVQRLYSAEAEARRDAEAAKQAAEAANRAKDEFLAMLGHELRNPLAPIVTALDIMKLRGDGGERERQIAERQCQYLVRLVDDLLDVSRITRGAVHLRREPTRLADAVAHAVEAASPLVAEREHKLSVKVPADITLDADHARLVQVLANLITNAAKYTPPHGFIDVRAVVDGELARIVVSDNGIGIPETLLPTVFEMFVQATRTTARGGGGLGLGLAIVKNLVELHGGRVTATSSGPGCGTEMTVWWPLSKQASQEAHPTPAVAPDRKLRVLVVDDNIDAANTLGDLLRALGHEVVVAHDAGAALVGAKQLSPNVALVDLGMPEIDGYALARQLRDRPGLVMFAVSGYGRPADRQRALDVGFADHLVKPVSLDDLRVVLAAVRVP